MGRADTVDLSAQVDALRAEVAALRARLDARVVPAATVAEEMAAVDDARFLLEHGKPGTVSVLMARRVLALHARNVALSRTLREVSAAALASDGATPPEGAAAPRGGAGSARGGAEGAEGSREGAAGTAGAVAGEGEVAT